MHTRIKAEITALARAIPDVEVCGFVYRDFITGTAQILACRNVAPNPAEEFEIDVQDQIRVMTLGRVLGIYHSHPAEPTAFSPADIRFADEQALPLYLVNAGDGSWSDYVPASYMVPLVGRDFCVGFADCWETPRIYFRQNHGIYLGDYDRDETYAHEEAGVIMTNYTREGFVQLPIDPAAVRPSDVLIFHTDKALPQHFGVFVGDGGRMLHHRIGRLSEIETITDRWWSRLVGIFRHQSLL